MAHSDFEAWLRFERAIIAEGQRLCRKGCGDTPCNCRAGQDSGWRRDAINSLNKRGEDG